MSNPTRHANIQRGVALHTQAVDIEKTIRVLEAHDGELAVCINTVDELTEAARALNHRAIKIIEDNDGETQWMWDWEANRLGK